MKIIVGLGNPGSKYEYNRHNVGFMVVDELVKETQDLKLKTQSEELKFKYDKKLQSLILTTLKPTTHHPQPTTYDLQLILAKPTTFMNSSGAAVKKLITHYKVNTSDLWVIHDDLDLRLGEYKIQFGVGPKLHYGISSIEKSLGTKDFWRVRVGVDNRKPENRIPGEEYVLQNFTKNEMFSVKEVIKRVVEDLMDRIVGGE